MLLSRLSVERYKSYRGPTKFDVAPLTIIVGRNNSGKTALAQAIHMLAGGISLAGDTNREPLPLNYNGVKYGDSFEDLVTGGGQFMVN